MRPQPRLTFVLAAICSWSEAQVCLTQSTNNNTVTPGVSVACAVGNPIQYTVENSYFRSYSLASLPGNVTITSIRFGAEQVPSTTGSRPMIIRLWHDPNGGSPAPYASLILRHTESFSLPAQTVPGIITHA